MRRPAALLAAALLGGALAGAADAAPAAPPDAALAARVERLADDLEASAEERATHGAVHDRLQLARAELASEGGDPAWLDPFTERSRAGEGSDPPALLVDAAGTLRIVASELHARDAGPAPIEAEATRALEALLADPEFAHVREGATEPGALERLGIWLRAWFFERFGSRGMTSLVGAAAWFVKVVLVLSGVLGLVWGVLRVRDALRALRARNASDEPGAGEEPATVERGASSRDELWRAGRFREALRMVHLETLEELARRGEASGVAGRTHWEELRRLAARGADRERVDGLAALNREFDRVWYGREAVDADRYERFAGGTRAWLESAPPTEERP